MAQMTREELMRFINVIYKRNNCNNGPLYDLKNILEEECPKSDALRLLDECVKMHPDLCAAFTDSEWSLNDATLKDVREKHNQRLRWEEENRRNGRC